MLARRANVPRGVMRQGIGKTWRAPARSRGAARRGYRAGNV